MNTGAAHRGERLRDMAVLIRSKNAGPFVLTVDMFFKSEADCRRVLDAGVLTPPLVASLYGIPAEAVRIIHVPQSNAIKVSIPRPRAAGDVGDCDVAGGQQFVPLLDISVPC